MQFLEQLTACMGQNVKFTIGPVCEGDELAAGVKWHLGILPPLLSPCFI